MGYIKGRERYIIESYIENINESKLYLSPELRCKLDKIGDEVSKSLLELEFNDSGEDITFLSLTGNDKMISFSRLDKVEKDIPLVNNKDLDDFSKEELDFLWSLNKRKSKDYWGIKKNKRINIKIGKLINKIFPGKFTDKQIEEFVNKFKSRQQSENTDFKMVPGEDIANFYRCDVEGGELGKSCMQNEPESYFEIYSKNPGSCKLLVLLGENDELLGRALVWNIDEFLNYEDAVNTGEIEFDYFMDRVYAVEDKYKYSFYEYCKKKGWARRAEGISNYMDVFYNGRTYNGLEMKVQLDYIPTKFPFMDTFKSLDVDEAVLYNFESGINDPWLEETDGGFWTLDPKEFVEIGSHKGELVDSSDTYTYKNKVYHKDDVIYNHGTGGVILKENAVYCIDSLTYLNKISSYGYYDKNDKLNGIVKMDEVSDTLWYKIIKNNWESNNNYSDIYGLYETTKKDFKGDHVLITDTLFTKQAENGEWYPPTEMELFNTKIKSDRVRLESMMEYYYRVWYNATWDGKDIDNLNPKNIKHNMVISHFRLNRVKKTKYKQFDKYIKNMNK